MNALLKLGIPVLVAGLLLFGTAYVVVKNVFPDMEISESAAAGHPLMLAAMYGGLLMAAVGILMILFGELKRKDEAGPIPKRPYARGKELRDQVPPGEQGLDPEEAAVHSQEVASGSPRRPVKTVGQAPPDRRERGTGPGDRHRDMVDEIRAKGEAIPPAESRGGETPKDPDHDPLRDDDPPRR